MIAQLFDRLERRFGRYAPEHLATYHVALMALTWVLDRVRPGFVSVMVLDPARVRAGEVWRLVTWVLLPAAESPVWVFFSLWWLYTIGTAVSESLGAFRYAVYWSLGVLATATAAFAFGYAATNTFLLASLLLAFATLLPDQQMMLFFVVPVKVKWLAYLDVALMLWQAASLPGWQKALPLVALANYLIFFGPTLSSRLSARLGGAVKAASRVRDEAPRERRRCSLCGVTDDDRSVEFRVCSCSKCGAPTEFCLVHARDH